MIHGELKKLGFNISQSTVPTINFKLVHVLVVIEHNRRKIIHFNVTKNPTAEWTLQQIRNLLFSFDTPKYLIRDRDSRHGNVFTTGVKNLGINHIVTSYRSPPVTARKYYMEIMLT